jgi:imidazoleglycerol-phosphate dehydratase/histidinol-phosphatase
MKKLLMIDRDGTIIQEPEDFQIDSLEKLSYLPGVFQHLSQIARSGDYELIMVSNQDGLGTSSFPEADFWPAHNKMLDTLKGEGIEFKDILIDPSLPEENSPNRKPKTGLMMPYFNGEYDFKNSVVIGDRKSDMELAKNLNAKGLWLNKPIDEPAIENTVAVDSWAEIRTLLLESKREVEILRNTKETKISGRLNLDGSGKGNINTGLNFFDHMLAQWVKHGNLDLDLTIEGDLEVDEHHTIEDCALALGEAFVKALGNKRGIMRYGFLLPMDDVLSQVALDFGGRPWLVWEGKFDREYVGDFPTEMTEHFFKSFADAAQCNLNIKVEGENTHHKIESIFKAIGKSTAMAVKRDVSNMELPTTKGVL